MSSRTTRQYTEVLAEGSGDLRVTRQHIEYLYPGAGEVRTTCQYVEVLHRVPEIFEPEATDTLYLTEAICQNYYYLSVADTFDLSETAERQHIASKDASDVLSLGEAAKRVTVVYVESNDFFHLADEALRLLPAVDTLSLADNADRQLITNLSVSDTLSDLSEEAARKLIISRTTTGPLIRISLSDTAVCQSILGRSVEDAFDFSDIASAEKIRPAIDTLVLIETAEAVKTQNSVDAIILSDSADAHKIYHRGSVEFLHLSEFACGGFEYACAATDILSLDDAALVEREAFDILTLADTAEAVSCRPAVDTFELSDSAVAYNCSRRLTEAFELFDSASVGGVYYRQASDAIGTFLSDTAGWTGPNYVTATDILQTSYIEYGPAPEYEETIVYLDLAENASATVTKHRPVTPTDMLDLGDSAEGYILNATHTGVATDIITLLESSCKVHLGETIDVVSLSESAEAILSKPAEDILLLSDTADRLVVFNLTASDNLELNEALLGVYSSLDDYLCIYHPFVGSGPASNPTPPPTELEGSIPGITTPFQLVYPVTGPFSDTLTLRAPNLGNRDRSQMNRISRETRGGTLIVYADPIWPKIQTLVLNFSGLTTVEAHALHTFMDDHLGQEIGLMDWEHRFWGGVLTKLDDPIVQDGKGCKFSVGLEFEGELTEYVPVPIP